MKLSSVLFMKSIQHKAIIVMGVENGAFDDFDGSGWYIMTVCDKYLCFIDKIAPNVSLKQSRQQMPVRT